MTNRWTGDYDVVVEASESGVDRLLAALHRKGNPTAAAADGPRLFHSFWINLPLGAVADGTGARGLLRLVTAPAKVSFPDSAGADRVRVAIDLYWHFLASHASAAAPEFAHGRVEATAAVALDHGSSELLGIAAVDEASLDLRFLPDSGAPLAPAELDLVERVLRNIALEALEPVSLRYGLTPELRGIDFKTLPAGTPGAAVAMLTLGDAPSAPDPARVTETFVHTGEDYALALGGEFATRQLVELARGFIADVAVRGSGSFFFISYGFEANARASSLTIELRAGVIRVTIGGDGRAWFAFFRSSFTFTLVQDFRLAVSGGLLNVEPAGAPDISASGLAGFLLGLLRGRAREALAPTIADIARQATTELRAAVDQALASLLAAVQIDPLHLAFTAASVDPDGIVLRGNLNLEVFRDPVALFEKYLRPVPESDPLVSVLELDAFESWIPGGEIQLYRWLLMRGDGTVVHQIDAPHRFVERVPHDMALGPGCLWPPCQWCLEVSGRQTAPLPGPDRAVAYRSCAIGGGVPTLDIPEGPGIGLAVPDGSGGVVAHIDPWGSFRPGGAIAEAGGTTYLVVHRAKSKAETAIALLAERAAKAEESGHRLYVLVIVDPDVELGKLQAAWPRVAFGVDPDGAWSRHFGVAQPDTTALFGLHAERLWRHEGALDEGLLAGVLAEHVTEPAGAPRFRQIRLRIGDCDHAPDFHFEHASGHRIAIRKFRGREVVVCFWRSWSAPSLEELKRLDAKARNTKTPPLILAVSDGEPAEIAIERFEQAGLDQVTLVTDPKRRIARKYGVHCWPTVVRIDVEGRVVGARFGLEGPPGPGPDQKQG